MRRTKSYNEELAERLKKPHFARGFLCALMEGDDGLSVEAALKHTIQVMGIKEFSKLSHVPSPNLVAFIKGRRNLKIETLDQLLKPFNLKIKLVVEKGS